MLVITRCANESICIGNDVELQILAVALDHVLLRVYNREGRLPADIVNGQFAVKDQIDLGGGITCDIADIIRDKVRIGITAPRQISVHRREVFDQIRRQARRHDDDNDNLSGSGVPRH